MQYILSSSFVSQVSVINITLFILLSIFGCPLLAKKWSLAWMLHIAASTCGIFFNSFVLLYSRRKLDILSQSIQPLWAYLQALKQISLELCCSVQVFINSQLLGSTSIVDFCRHFGLHGLLTYMRSVNAVNLGARNRKVVKKDFRTPDLNSTQTIKSTKAQSDPVKKPFKLSVKDKYLPAKSPELFKNKIYLTRRNLNNALLN